MERFREHEKEFKMKQYSKKALQKMNRDGGSNNSQDSDYGEEYYQESEGEEEAEFSVESDKVWLEDFIKNYYTPFLQKLENELDSVKSKKHKG